jgi:hypothetical protein
VTDTLKAAKSTTTVPSTTVEEVQSALAADS